MGDNWHHKDRPSEHYLGAILRAYDKAEAEGKDVTASKLWDYVVMECLRSRDGFRTMFQWDHRKKVNRVGDIAEVIAAGFVPGLKLGQDGRGREIVEATR